GSRRASSPCVHSAARWSNTTRIFSGESRPPSIARSRIGSVAGTTNGYEVSMRLDGKVALITGAGSGIGRESALLFAAEGAPVVVVDIEDQGGEETVTAITSSGGRAVYVHADVSNAADTARMIASAEREFGPLNVLFNNAGIMHSRDDDA